MVVYLTYNLSEAYIIAGRLEVEGVPAMVHRQAGAGAFGITVGSLGEVSVLVHPPDYERALAILDTDVPDELPSSTNNVVYFFDDEVPESLDDGDDEHDTD
jgi:hypothetical protein